MRQGKPFNCCQPAPIRLQACGRHRSTMRALLLISALLLGSAACAAAQEAPEVRGGGIQAQTVCLHCAERGRGLPPPR